MSTKQHRVVFGVVLVVTRMIGWILIALAVLGLLHVRSHTEYLALSFSLLTSVALGLVGVAWLVGVEMFLRFFDRYLSPN